MSERVERILAELAAEAYWRRDTAIEELCAAEPVPLLDALATALAHPHDPDRRNSARTALAVLARPGAVDPGAAVERLRALLTDGPDADVRLLAANAMGESGNPAARRPLELVLGDADENVAAAAADALGDLEDPLAADALARVVREGGFWTRAAAVSALGRIGGEAAREALEHAASDPSLAALAATALGETGEPGVLDALRLPLAASPEARLPVLRAAASTLGANPGTMPPRWLREAAAPVAEELLEGGDPSTDLEAARLLGILGTPAAAKRLVEALCASGADESPAVGIGLLPGDIAAPVVLRELGAKQAPRGRVRLLSALPPLRDAGSMRAVAEYLSDPAREVRAAAADVLGRSDPEIALPLLRELVRDPGRRLAAIRAAGRLEGVDTRFLEPFVEDPSAEIRGVAAEGLARRGPDAVPLLSAALANERDAEARTSIVRSLGIAGDGAAARALAPIVDAGDPSLRFAAVEALGRTGSPEAYAPLLRALSDPLPELQAAALYALGELGDARASDPIAERLGSRDSDMRRAAAIALDRLPSPAALDRLVAALDDPDREVRVTAIRLLARLAPGDQIHRLEALREDPDPIVRRAADDAIRAARDRTAEG